MQEQNFRELYLQTLEKMTDLTERQKKVLQAALELFAAQGFEATTSAQIAKKAGVSVGSVYHHFPNKQALLIAVLSPVFRGTLESAANEFMTNTFSRGFVSLDEFITSVVTDRMTYIYDNVTELKLMFGQLLTNTQFVGQIKVFFGKQLALFVLPAIEQFKKEGKIADLPNEIILQLTFGTIIGYFGKLILNINSLPIEQEISYARELLLKTLRP